MKNDDRFKYLVGGYYGIKSMDDYQSKLYVLKDVEKYIKDYCNSGEEKYDYKSIAEEIYANTSLKEKLQDSLILLNDMKGPIELVIMIKQKIKEIKYNEDHQRWTFLFDEEMIKSIKEYLGLYDEVKEKYPDIFAEYQELVDSIKSIHKKHENHAYKLN